MKEAVYPDVLILCQLIQTPPASGQNDAATCPHCPMSYQADPITRVCLPKSFVFI